MDASDQVSIALVCVMGINYFLNDLVADALKRQLSGYEQYKKEQEMLNRLFIGSIIGIEPSTVEETEVLETFFILGARYGNKVVDYYMHQEDWYNGFATVLTLVVPLLVSAAILKRKLLKVDRQVVFPFTIYVALYMYISRGFFTRRAFQGFKSLSDILDEMDVKNNYSVPKVNQEELEQCKGVLKNLNFNVDDLNELRKDFLKWSLVNHPDKGGDEMKFKKVSRCRDVMNENEVQKKA